MADLFRKKSIEKISNPEQLDRAITISSPLSWLALIGIVIILSAGVAWSILGVLPTIVEADGVICTPADSCAIYSDFSGIVTNIVKKAGDSFFVGDELAVIREENGTERTITASGNGHISRVLIEKGNMTYVGTEIFRYSPDIGQDQMVVCYVPSNSAAQFKKNMKVIIYPSSIDTQTFGHMEGEIDHIGEYSADIRNMAYVLGNNNLVAERFLDQGPVVALAVRIKADGSSENGFWWSNDKGKSLAVTNGSFVSTKIVIEESAPITKLFEAFKG